MSSQPITRSILGLAAAFTAANASANVIINEFLFDPAPTAPDGDANGDGVREASGDEFIEILNTGSTTVDISGWTLSDDDGGAFAFAAGTFIAPGEFIVLFGGGTPTGIPGQVFVDDGTIGTGLSNAGDVIQLIDDNGVTVDEFDYNALDDAGFGADVSLAFNGTEFVDQDTLLPGVLFTPGASNFIPEPGSIVLLLGAGCLVARRRRVG